MMYWFLLPLVFSSTAIASTQEPFEGDSVGNQLLADQSILIEEEVYVESPTDTDGDGRLDLIYTKVSRTGGATNLPTIFTMTPYALGGNNAPNHSVDVARLPQEDEQSHHSLAYDFHSFLVKKDMATEKNVALARGYAEVTSDSVGTGRSTGCPTVGDMAETLAAKAVIDWLNGRAKAFTSQGREVVADWSNGNVGMSGVSYNGTLPNMVATTGVEGLKAIVPIAAISSWYNYYRANGLVVGPGGYIGEDADVLGKFIVRRGACQAQLNRMTQDMGREHGDFTQFWQDRDYVSRASGVTAAVFIVHGQSDWNVKMRHATEWWNALSGQVPLRLWLHNGGHGNPNRSDWTDEKYAWFDHYVKGENNGVEQKPRVEVQYPAGNWSTQNDWPSESTQATTMYLNPSGSLSPAAGTPGQDRFSDRGKSQKVEALVGSPSVRNQGRLAFVSAALPGAVLLSGTPLIRLELSLVNRRAANLTVALVEYRSNNSSTIVTRGWADPQNHADITQGDSITPGETISVSFDLEPKQYRFAAGSRIGIVVTSTDYDYTLRPDQGTEMVLTLGEKSSVELMLEGL